MSKYQDEIRIEDLEVFARHGVYPEETKLGQPFRIRAVLYTDIRKAGVSDDLEESTNYGEVCHFITKWMQEHTCKLLESVAERLAGQILIHFPLIQALDLEIRKPQAPIGLPFGYVSVKINRAWHQVFLSFGSNLGDRLSFIRAGLSALEEYPGIRIIKISDIIRTEPYGGVEQGDFLNGVLELETLLTPEELLELLHQIEAAAGRERVIHWGPRTLDLDILFYDKLVLEEKDLVIPHIDLQNRYFVLKPMAEIAPHFRHPVLGSTMIQLLQQLPKK